MLLVNMNARLFTLLLCLAFAQAAIAQDDNQITRFQMGSYELGIRSDGLLFVGDDDHPGLQFEGISLVDRMGFSLSGFDPFGNFKYAGQFKTLQDEVDNFTSGVRFGNFSEPEVKDFFTITKDEIEAHIIDYNDNGIIDQPIENVLNWPAQGNVFFQDKYGVSLTSTQVRLGFYDKNSNGVYEPMDGEYPLLSETFIPEKAIVKFFTPKMGSSLSNLNLAVILYHVDCHVTDVNVKDVIYVDYQWVYTGFEDLRKIDLAFDLSIDMGANQNEHLAYDSLSNTVFAYQSPLNSDDDIGDGVLGIYNYEPNYVWTGEELMPFYIDRFFYYEDGGIYGGPENLVDYQSNFLNSKWNDGMPKVAGGNAYPQDANTLAETDLVYTGDPSSPSEWSEISANINAGKRNASWINKYPKFQPSGVYRKRLAIEFAPTEDALPDFEDADLRRGYIHSIHRLDVGVDCSLLDLTNTKEVLDDELSVYPNPTLGDVYVSSNLSVKEVAVYNDLGQLICIDDCRDFHVSLPYAGCFNLVFSLSDGSKLTKRIISIAK